MQALHSLKTQNARSADLEHKHTLRIAKGNSAEKMVDWTLGNTTLQF